MVENENDDEATGGLRRETGAGAAQGSSAGAVAGAPAATDVQAYIGRQLRAVYDDIAKQPIPDRFVALMRQLETKGAG